MRCEQYRVGKSVVTTIRLRYELAEWITRRHDIFRFSFDLIYLTYWCRVGRWIVSRIRALSPAFSVLWRLDDIMKLYTHFFTVMSIHLFCGLSCLFSFPRTCPLSVQCRVWISLWIYFSNLTEIGLDESSPAYLLVDVLLSVQYFF